MARMAVRRTTLFVALLVAAMCFGCGGSSRSTETGTATGLAGGGLGNVPVFGRMHPVGDEQHVNGVTSRTYELADLSPRIAMSEYEKVIGRTSWREAEAPRRIGTTTWRGAWKRNGNTLVVAATAAPTLGSGSTTTTQMSMQLYPVGTTPST